MINLESFLDWSKTMDNYEKLQKIVTDAMKNQLKTDVRPSVKYTSIDEYKRVTGKRFRITREQRDRGISREQAFTEFMNKDKK